MSQPFLLEIISDEEDDDVHHHHHHHHHHHQKPDVSLSPVTLPSKKRRTEENNFSADIILLDDDPTPNKLSKPVHIPDTPLSYSPNPIISDISTPKCTSRLSDPVIKSLPAFSLDERNNGSGASGLICLESDNESEGGIQIINSEDEGTIYDFGTDLLSTDFGYQAVHGEKFTQTASSEVNSDDEEENLGNATKKIDKISTFDENRRKEMYETKANKRKTKEEKVRLAEEKKLMREQEKLREKVLKEETAKAKKLQKELEKWEKGKFAVKSIVAEIDTKVIELGSIGGHLLSMFAEKGISFRITSNPIKRSILWTISIPEELSELSSKGSEVPYVLLVYEAEEFYNLIIDGSLLSHVSEIQSRYSSYTVCYLTNKLIHYINKRDQAPVGVQSNGSPLSRNQVEEVLSDLVTCFARVHSRHCRDEAEIADHVVGLTCSLANCHFRKKLTRLSTKAIGAADPKDCVDRNLIKKSVWLKALVSIPKLPPKYAIAIWKKYSTMKSLLTVYMDPSKSVHEKEALLKGLPTEDLLGDDDRRVGGLFSRRVYRILMAQNGNIATDDVDVGADFFS